MVGRDVFSVLLFGVSHLWEIRINHNIFMEPGRAGAGGRVGPGLEHSALRLHWLAGLDAAYAATPFSTPDLPTVLAAFSVTVHTAVFAFACLQDLSYGHSVAKRGTRSGKG